MLSWTFRLFTSSFLRFFYSFYSRSLIFYFNMLFSLRYSFWFNFFLLYGFSWWFYNFWFTFTFTFLFNLNFLFYFFVFYNLLFQISLFNCFNFFNYCFRSFVFYCRSLFWNRNRLLSWFALGIDLLSCIYASSPFRSTSLWSWFLIYNVLFVNFRCIFTFNLFNLFIFHLDILW